MPRHRIEPEPKICIECNLLFYRRKNEELYNYYKKSYCGSVCKYKNNSNPILDRNSTFPDPVSGSNWINLGNSLFALVDSEDYESLNTFVWHVRSDGYAVRNKTKAESSIRGLIRMHRQVLNVDNTTHVDHVNGNILDNRRSNLREANDFQNSGNQKIRKNNTSGYKGVVWDKRDEKWLAQISISGKGKYLGRFDTVEQAAKSYDEAARLYFGEFAALNIPNINENTCRRK